LNTTITVLSVYFWMVVEAARNQWYEQNRIANCEPNTLDFVSMPTS